MTRRVLLAALLGLSPEVARAQQTFTPQTPAGLTVSFTTEKAGGTRSSSSATSGTAPMRRPATSS